MSRKKEIVKLAVLAAAVGQSSSLLHDHQSAKAALPDYRRLGVAGLFRRGSPPTAAPLDPGGNSDSGHASVSVGCARSRRQRDGRGLAPRDNSASSSNRRRHREASEWRHNPPSQRHPPAGCRSSILGHVQAPPPVPCFCRRLPTGLLQLPLIPLRLLLLLPMLFCCR